jgi:hypothetical protein
MIRDDDDPAAPPFCVAFTSTDVHATAYDSNPKCTPASGQWDNSWGSYIPLFCDSWFRSIQNPGSWIRVNPLWWNKTCNCSSSQLDTYTARQSGCQDPYQYQLSKYIQFTHYVQAGVQYKMKVYYKAWTSAQDMASKGNMLHTCLVHTCNNESKGVEFSIIGKVGDGLIDLVPAAWATKMSGLASSAVYLLLMGDGTPLDVYVMDGTTPETVKKRLARMDYVDKSATVVDPPIQQSLSRKFWIRLMVLVGIILTGIAYYKIKGPKKTLQKMQ